ncbi:MAG: response regulator [Bacteroidetes bacterium]|nr:response regulator [Bacteroidota bacterium]
MDMKNLKIGVQLKLSFATILLFVIALGVISYWQSDLIHKQTEIIYEHPFKVRRALGNLQSSLLNIRILERDLMLANTAHEKQNDIQLIELSSANALLQFDILKEQYLGSRTDLDEAYNAFISWNTARQENTKLALSGEIEKAIANQLPTGNIGIYREQMMSKIKKIDDFSIIKADSLYNNSTNLKKSLDNQLILMAAIILLLSIIIYFRLLRNIKKPLDELTDASERFKNGNMNARSLYTSKNEFGELSLSFNTMVDNIQENNDLDEKFANLAALMLSEYDAKKFFQATLNGLAKHTGSQMAAIYLLSDDKKTYNHFESLGADKNAKKSFAADTFEGEFGSVIATRKIQHIKNIHDDTRFVFYTVSGKFIPHEIITIPIHADKEVIAIISLASISSYSKQSIQLIEKILITLSTRVEGILAYHKMQEFSKKLEFQNRELEMQKTELSSQSAELVEQNIELEMQKKQLDETSRLKTTFLSNMSHELRTPLNSVIALSGVLNRRLAKQIPDEEYSYLEVIERNGKHLLDLINDILDISRIEAGREEIEITKFGANSLIADVVSMIRPQAKEKKIKLEHSKIDSDIFITSDISKCHHILQNIVSNAVKFTEKGKVEITTILKDNNILITVKDTGIGISGENLPHIFDEFRQADSSNSRKFGGTGLGLAIAKKYANILGGTISAISNIGKGSEFTLSLPLQYESKNRITDIEHASEFRKTVSHIPDKTIHDTSIKTILIVEDSEPAIIQIKDFLEESGYNILVAHNGIEAIKTIEQTIPDAMILDLMMPDIDGFEVLKTIREEERTIHIPVLILTAKHITKKELAFLKQNNIHQLIQKGDINRNELQNAVATMVFPETIATFKPKQVLQTFVTKPVVLIVEDNPDNMLTTKALLENNYTVIEATNGNKSVEIANKYKPNLILMDIALPELDGIEAFKAMRKNAELQHVPIIALTASAMTSDRETILAYGFDAYITKPIENVIFLKTINEVLYGK